MAAKDAVGRYGERVVAERLAALGWEVLERNWRCALGELDIVAIDHGCVVAVEVKTRRTTTFGSPLEAVTPVKVARIRKLLAAWLASQPRTFEELRIDVATVGRPLSGYVLPDMRVRSLEAILRPLNAMSFLGGSYKSGGWTPILCQAVISTGSAKR